MTIKNHRIARVWVTLSLLIGTIQLPVYTGQTTNTQGFLVAQAQIDTSKLQNKVPVSPVKSEGVDPKSLAGSTKSSLKIAGVSEVTVLSTSVVTVQGRGRVESVELSFFVSVSNRGTSTDDFQLVTKVNGATTVNRTSRFTIQPNQTDRKSIRFTTEFELPSGSTRLPITVTLYNRDNVAIEHTDRTVDMSTAIGQLRQRMMIASATRDLALSEMTINYRRERANVGPVNIDNRRTLQAVVTVRNVGTERWGYPASLTISYQMGRPGSLRPLSGNSGQTKPQTFGLRHGEQTVIAYDAPQLNPGYYYTATATISTRDDLNRENNTRQFVFFIESDGRITPVESAFRPQPGQQRTPGG